MLNERSLMHEAMATVVNSVDSGPGNDLSWLVAQAVRLFLHVNTPEETRPGALHMI